MSSIGCWRVLAAPFDHRSAGGRYARARSGFHLALIGHGRRLSEARREVSMQLTEQQDAEFMYKRGRGTRRHREMCAANAKSANEPTATGSEPRCKVCEAKLEAALRR